MSNDNRPTNLFFQSKPCLSSHVYALKKNPESYINELVFLCESGTVEVVSAGVKARILAALHIMKKHKMVSFFLEHCEATDISKALSFLDRPRRIHQFSRKITKIENEHPNTLQMSEEEEEECKDECKKTADSCKQDKTKHRKKRRRIDVYRRQKKAAESEMKEDEHDDQTCADAHADTAVKELIDSASVSGALARKVRQWAKTNLKSDFLEFVMLALPGGPWANLADLVHFNPGDFSVPYFLADVFETTNKSQEDSKESGVPKGSFVSRVRDLVGNLDASDPEKCEDMERRFLALAEEFPQIYLCYSFIRTHPALMKNAKIVEDLAKNIPIDSLIWYFEEIIAVPHVSKSIVVERLQNADDLTSRSIKAKATYGKLVERILTARRMHLPKIADGIIPLAADQLDELKSTWNKKIDAKVAVFGDASASMTCAIEAAAIFASMASVCFDGELSFFSGRLVKSPHEKPKSVKDTLEICDEIRARGCTSLAAALWPYYRDKKFMDMFVLVTDEEENTSDNNYFFADLLAKYKAEINKDVTLVVVCVGSGCSQFRNSLKCNHIDYRVVHIDGSRPDLAKFGAILGQLAMMSSRFVVPSGEKSEGGTEEKEAKNEENKSNGEEFVMV